jgi:cellulose synthase/poly-beta-1,6-N-acetylglucosamine synthase-like glycosyltransferase
VTALEQLLWIASLAIFVFFVFYSFATLALIALSLVEASTTRIERGDLFAPPLRRRRPGITIIAPAYNEEAVIVASTRSLLAADYEPLEVVIVDDGSRDGTTTELVRAFDLIDLPVGDRFRIATAPLEQLYVSRRDPRLRVLRKQNGGRSDAVNAGLNIARQELVAIVDSDSLLERDALLRIAEVFAADPDHVVAVGGTIRIANGAVIEQGIVTRPRVAVSGTEASQTGEYLRGFLGTRIAWSRLNGLLIISGAFGVFRRDLLRAVGGLSSATLGEDMEVVLRLHHRLRPARPQTRIVYAADATCWTEAPAGLRPLRGQRIRWHVGLIDNLRLHREMIGRRRFGAVGLFALPYTVLFEVLSPLLQVAGYAILVVLTVLGLTSWVYTGLFLVVTVLVGQLQTAGAILIEEVGFRRYRNRDLMLLGLWGLLETLWYRPLTALWRVWATVLVITGRRPGWGSIPRGVALAEEEPEVDFVAAPLPR